MKRFATIFSILVFLIGVPLVVGYAAGLVPCDGPECQTCHFVDLLKRVIDFFVKFLVAASTLIFAYAGFRMVTSAGNPGDISAAKGMMTNAIVGLVILLAAWLIVDTVMKILVGDGKLLRPWYQIQCVTQPVGKDPVLGTVTSGGSGTIPTGTVFHGDALARLAVAGINVTSSKGEVRPDCTGVDGCTSLNGIRESTVQNAIDLKNACKCDITITGGTEGNGGHNTSTTGSGHTDGYKYDVRLNDGITNYITTTYGKTKGTRSDGATTYTAPNGTIYALEDDHWDVKAP